LRSWWIDAAGSVSAGGHGGIDGGWCCASRRTPSALRHNDYSLSRYPAPLETLPRVASPARQARRPPVAARERLARGGRREIGRHGAAGADAEPTVRARRSARAGRPSPFATLHILASAPGRSSVGTASPKNSSRRSVTWCRIVMISPMGARRARAIAPDHSLPRSGQNQPTSLKYRQRPITTATMSASRSG
jgi:hypothetical protein